MRVKKYILTGLALSVSTIAISSELKLYACGVTRVAFMKELNQAFSQKFNLDISMNKSGGDIFVIKGVNNKKVDLGSGCRESIDTSKDEKNVESIQVAWGALSFIVNSKNSVTNITTKQIKDILIGRVVNWKEIGGDDKPINLIIRESKKSGVGLSAREALFKNIDEDFYSKAKKVKSSGFVRDAVAKDENAFAIDNTMSSAKNSSIKMLSVDGVEPTKANILSGKYKMRQALYIYLPKNPSKVASKYAKFALSKEGQAVISKTGTANLAEASGKNDEDNYMIQNLLMDLQ
jgi:phosphate transport system substrate-binding protein